MKFRETSPKSSSRETSPQDRTKKRQSVNECHDLTQQQYSSEYQGLPQKPECVSYITGDQPKQQQANSLETGNHDWSAYYETPRTIDSLADTALSHLLKKELKEVTILVLDAACGNGRNSFPLIDKCRESNQPVHVTAFDENKRGLEYLIEKKEEYPSKELKIVQSNFNTFSFDENNYHFVMAIRAIPFNDPKTCTEVFTRMINSVREDGLFAGHFFDPDHGFNTEKFKEKMSFHTPEDIINLFSSDSPQEDRSPAHPAQELSSSQQLHSDSDDEFYQKFRQKFHDKAKGWELVNIARSKDIRPAYEEGTQTMACHEYRVITRRCVREHP